MAVYGGQQPHFSACKLFNFSESQLSIVQPLPSSELGPAAQHVSNYGFSQRTAASQETIVTEPMKETENEVPPSQNAAHGDRKPVASYQRAGRSEAEQTLIQGILRAGVDSIIIATKYHPLPLFKTMLPLLRPSKPFVLYFEYIEVRGTWY
jgi:hypothetical protein